MDRDSETHPCSRARLAVILEQLDALGYLRTNNVTEASPTLWRWREELQGALAVHWPSSVGYARAALLNDGVRRKFHEVVERYCEDNGHTAFDASSYTGAVPELVDALQKGLPPIPQTQKASPLAAVLNAAWQALMHPRRVFNDFKPLRPPHFGRAVEAVSGLCFKGIEAAQVLEQWGRQSRRIAVDPLDSEPNASPDGPAGAILTEAEVGRRLKDDLVVTPLLGVRQVGEASVNLRLGTHFIVTKAADLPYFNPASMGDERILRIQQHVSRSFGDSFVLHPRRLVLGVTFEYIALPRDLAALVLSRSSYGRIGLIVATATFVHPNWKGCLTLELTNVADVPLELQCGAPVAQLVLFHAEKLKEDPRKAFPLDGSVYPTFPRFSALASHPDWKKLRRISRRTSQA
jgi:dCTP deaminase